MRSGSLLDFHAGVTDQALATTDLQAQQKLWGQIDHKAMEDAIIVPLNSDGAAPAGLPRSVKTIVDRIAKGDRLAQLPQFHIGA